MGCQLKLKEVQIIFIIIIILEFHRDVSLEQNFRATKMRQVEVVQLDKLLSN